METALPILLFFGFLFGSTLLILICGIRPADQEEPITVEDWLAQVGSTPRFFGRPGEQGLPNPVAVVVDGPMASRVEEFLRDELALAELFVGDPSVEGLHREADAREPGLSVFERLERHLRAEHELASRFLSDPSVESLYGRPDASPAFA